MRLGSNPCPKPARSLRSISTVSDSGSVFTRTADSRVTTTDRFACGAGVGSFFTGVGGSDFTSIGESGSFDEDKTLGRPALPCSMSSRFSVDRKVK